MTAVRALVVMLLAIMLVACDSGQDAPRKPLSPPPQAAPVAAEAPSPAPLLAPPAAPREVAPAASPRPQPKVVPAPPAHPPRPQPQPARAPAEASRRAPPAEPEAPLDLSLPKELTQGLGLPRDKVAGVTDRQALLPPLFELKDKERQAPGSFEIGGRLITNERPAPGKDYWNTVEGAEVQLHFRQ